MLQNAYLLAKIGADTAENEQHFAEILPKTGVREHRNAPAGASSGGSSAPAAARSCTAARRLGSCQFLAKFRQNFARFRLYRRRSLQLNMRFAAFCKIYQII